MEKINFNKIIQRDRRTIAKAMTLIESTKVEDSHDAYKLIDQILKYNQEKNKQSKIIAITGVPGVGKSTFIEMLGMLLIEKKNTVAVLAIDPSSPISGGSLLGDKTRMEKLSRETNAFIRPSTTAGIHGGVARKTQALTFLCEAASFDYILIETVGVGQSEYDVHQMSDLFVLLTLPNSGDQLQGIKKGIIELANLILINKTDQNLKQAEISKSQIEEALHLTNNQASILLISALNEIGFEEVYQIFKNIKVCKQKRLDQISNWKYHLFASELTIQIKRSEAIKDLFNSSKEISILNFQSYIDKILKV